jgi:hypothetical protein
MPMWNGNLNLLLRRLLRMRRADVRASERKNDSTLDDGRTMPSDNPDTLVGASRAARSGMTSHRTYTRPVDRQPDGDSRKSQ